MRTLIVFLLAVLALPTMADDPIGAPTRKHGLWEMNMETGGHRMTMRHCVGPGSDSVSQHQGGPNMGAPNARQKQNCSKQTINRQSGKVVLDSVCKHGDTTITTHAEFTGDFNTGYRADMHSRFDPPMRGGVKEARQVMTMRWLGPCKPGQKPGDVEMQMPGQEGRGGGSFNMKDLMDRMKR